MSKIKVVTRDYLVKQFKDYEDAKNPKIEEKINTKTEEVKDEINTDITSFKSEINTKVNKTIKSETLTKIWNGTKEQFDSIETKDSSTIYIVEEENSDIPTTSPAVANLYIGAAEPEDKNAIWIDTQE